MKVYFEGKEKLIIKNVDSKDMLLISSSLLHLQEFYKELIDGSKNEEFQEKYKKDIESCKRIYDELNDITY